MKWAKSRNHCPDYYAWQDLGRVMFVTLVLALIASLVIALLVFIMSPGVATAGDVTNYRQARRLAVLPIDKVTTRASEPVKTLFMEVSAYSPSVFECDSNPMTTASGKRVYVGGVAADLSRFPFGTILLIPGYNGGKPCQVIDTGSAIKGAKLDVFFFSTHEAAHFGRRRNVKVQVLYVPRVKK